MSTKFRGLTTMDMFMDTWICGLQIDIKYFWSQ